MKEEVLSNLIRKRMEELLYERDIRSVNMLANKSYLTQSTVNNLINGKSKNPKLKTILLVCYGFDITVKDFFSSKLFEDFKIENIL